MKEAKVWCLVAKNEKFLKLVAMKKQYVSVHFCASPIDLIQMYTMCHIDEVRIPFSEIQC